VTVWQTILIYIAIPAGIYGLIALLTLARKSTKPKYSAGKDWTFEPVLWVADSESGHHGHAGHHDAHATESAEPVVTARGGARGGW
jgi:hypothetical protein